MNKNKLLITGATSGIGLALLEELVKLDNQVIALGRNEEKLNELAKKNGRIIPFKCDLSIKEELDLLLEFIKNEHQDLNVLINNAGIQYNYDFNDQTQLVGKVEREIEVNLTVPIKLIGLLLPTISSNDNAAIINVSSGLALVPKMAAPVYCGTKAAIHIFSKSLRYQLEDKVKVFEIIPPLVDTHMTKGRGKGKITPQQLVKEAMKSLRRDRYEISIGKVKLLKVIQRINPKLADKIMKGTLL